MTKRHEMANGSAILFPMTGTDDTLRGRYQAMFDAISLNGVKRGGVTITNTANALELFNEAGNTDAYVGLKRAIDEGRIEAGSLVQIKDGWFQEFEPPADDPED